MLVFNVAVKRSTVMLNICFFGASHVTLNKLASCLTRKERALSVKIAVLNAKGGVGKTTVTMCLAVAAVAKKLRVGLVDLDPQQSLASWYGLRANRARMTLAEDCYDLDKASEMLADSDLIFADCPPSQMKILTSAAGWADYVVVPLRAGAIDVGALQTAIDLCDEARVEFGLLLSDVRPNEGSYKAVVQYLLDNELPLIESAVVHRVSHSYAAGHGLSAAEPVGGRVDAAAQREIDHLWKEVWKLARAAKKAREAAQ